MQAGSSHSLMPGGGARLPPQQDVQTAVSDALKAFAQLQLQQPASSGPYSL